MQVVYADRGEAMAVESTAAARVMAVEEGSRRSGIVAAQPCALRDTIFMRDRGCAARSANEEPAFAL